MHSQRGHTLAAPGGHSPTGLHLPQGVELAQRRDSRWSPRVCKLARGDGRCVMPVSSGSDAQPPVPFLRPCSVLTLAACPSCSHWTTGDRRADDVDYRCAYSMSTVTACPLPSARTLCGEGEQKQRGIGPCTAGPRSGRAGTLYRRRLGIPPATGGRHASWARAHPSRAASATGPAFI